MIKASSTKSKLRPEYALFFGVFALMVLVLSVYRPLLPGAFILDDQHLLEAGNPLVTGEFKPYNIWFQTDFTFSTFVFWVQSLVWGLNPGPYHAVNMSLHLLSSVLLWRLLARLRIPGAWLAAAMFAIHPVCVNSVGRIAELKNTLSLPFFLLSLWLYLRYDKLTSDNAKENSTAKSRAWLYGLALGAFVFALLSKTSTVMLPGVLLCCLAWQHRRITRSDLLHLSPFLFLAATFGLMSIWFQKHIAMQMAGQTLAPMSFADHITVAARVFWFYLGKALFPLNLNVVYPRWNMPPDSISTYLPFISLLAAFLLCWRFRRSGGRHILFGLGIFAVTLFPVLGFFDSQFLTAWQVSDHLQYLPLIAPVTLVAAGLALIFHGRYFHVVAAAVIVNLALLCSQRAHVFASPDRLFEDTIAKNPDAWKAHNDLGVLLAARASYALAEQHFAASLKTNPDNQQAHVNFGHTLALQGKFHEAEPHFQAALKIAPFDPESHKSFAAALDQQGRTREALHHLMMASRLKSELRTHLDLATMLRDTGDTGQAIVQYRHALALNPNCVEALNNVAWMLATAGDKNLRNGAEAVRYAEHASRLPAPKDMCILGTLAAAYAEAGRFPEAISTAESAVKTETSSGRENIAELNRQLLGLYRNGKAWHDRPATGRQYGAN